MRSPTPTHIQKYSPYCTDFLFQLPMVLVSSDDQRKSNHTVSPALEVKGVCSFAYLPLFAGD